MDPRIRLSEKMLSTVGDASSTLEGEPARAASVVLLRDSRSGPEVLVQLRASSMAFAGGRPVFPGGRLDPGDGQGIANWAGPSREDWASTLDTDPETATAVVAAAIRETFEESGYLLASTEDGEDIAHLDDDDWRTDRDLLADHRISLADLLAKRRLIPRTDWLKAWSVWVTPEFEPRRFHTWFLIARAPMNQRVLGVSREATSNQWLTADRALREADSGTLQMLPPQYCTFLELHGHRDADAVFAIERPVSTVRPGVATDEDGAYLVLPDQLVELGRRIGELMYQTTEGTR